MSSAPSTLAHTLAAVAHTAAHALATLDVADKTLATSYVAIATAMSRIGTFALDYPIVKACTGLDIDHPSLRFIFVDIARSIMNTGLYLFAWPEWLLDTMGDSDEPARHVATTASPIAGTPPENALPPLFGADQSWSSSSSSSRSDAFISQMTPLVASASNSPQRDMKPALDELSRIVADYTSESGNSVTRDRERDRDRAPTGDNRAQKRDDGRRERSRMRDINLEATPKNIRRLLSENERFLVHFRYRRVDTIDDITPLLLAYEIVRERRGARHVNAFTYAEMFIDTGVCPRIMTPKYVRAASTSTLLHLLASLVSNGFKGNIKRLFSIMADDDAYRQTPVAPELLHCAGAMDCWVDAIRTEIASRK